MRFNPDTNIVQVKKNGIWIDTTATAITKLLGFNYMETTISGGFTPVAAGVTFVLGSNRYYHLKRTGTTAVSTTLKIDLSYYNRISLGYFNASSKTDISPMLGISTSRVSETVSMESYKIGSFSTTNGIVSLDVSGKAGEFYIIIGVWGGAYEYDVAYLELS